MVPARLARMVRGLRVNPVGVVKRKGRGGSSMMRLSAASQKGDDGGGGQ